MHMKGSQSQSPVTEQFSENRLNAKEISVEEIQDWLVDHIAEEINVDPDEIELGKPFSSYGLSSVQAMNLANLGKEQLGVQISPLAIWNCPNIELLSQHLFQELSVAAVEMFEI